MKKKIIIILLVLVALSSILFFNMGNKSTAEECNDCTRISTGPGNSDFKKINCNCTGAIPTIKASASEIASGGSMTLWVDSGGKACPDFTWSVSSAEYTLNKSNTKNDLETVTMSAATGTCSTTGYNNSNIYVTVTVTDRCGNTNQTVIRNTSGRWVLVSTAPCSSSTVGTWAPIYYKTIGEHRWRITVGKSQTTQHRNLSCNCNTYAACYPVCIGSYGDINQNKAIWWEAVETSGYGLLSCCTWSDGSSPMGIWGTCGSGKSWLMYVYNVDKWSCQ